MQRGFGLILLILFVAIISLVAGGAYYLGKNTNVHPVPSVTFQTPPTPFPTTSPSSIPSPSLSSGLYTWESLSSSEDSSWKVYHKYGFSFKYPSDWRLEEPTSGDQVAILTPDVVGGLGRKSGISVSLFDAKQKHTAKDYITQYLVPLAKLNNDPGVPHIIENQPSYINNLNAVVVDNLSGAGNPGPSMFIFNDAKGMGDEIIELSTESIDINVASKVFSSFKFD